MSDTVFQASSLASLVAAWHLLDSVTPVALITWFGVQQISKMPLDAVPINGQIRHLRLGRRFFWLTFLTFHIEITEIVELARRPQGTGAQAAGAAHAAMRGAVGGRLGRLANYLLPLDCETYVAVADRGSREAECVFCIDVDL